MQHSVTATYRAFIYKIEFKINNHSPDDVTFDTTKLISLAKRNNATA